MLKRATILFLAFIGLAFLFSSPAGAGRANEQVLTATVSHVRSVPNYDQFSIANGEALTIDPRALKSEANITIGGTPKDSVAQPANIGLKNDYIPRLIRHDHYGGHDTPRQANFIFGVYTAFDTMATAAPVRQLLRI